MPKTPFKNRHNEQVKTEDGRTIWLARCCAVVAQVCLYDVTTRKWYVLLGKRGTGTPDFQGYWNLPCGYLDWDETLTEAMVREVWEECGLMLPELKNAPQFVWSGNACISQDSDYEESPWAIADKPNLGFSKQNISMHYAILFSWRGQPLPALSDENAEPNEVAGIDWVIMEEACEMELAFNHTKRIRQLMAEKRELFEMVEQQV